MTVGQSIWHCKRTGVDENGISVYAKPKEYKLKFNYLSLVPTNGYLDTVQYGEKVTRMWTMKALKSMFNGIFAEGDVLYVEGAEPDLNNPNYINGDGANALVTNVSPLLVSITVKLEKTEP